MKTEGDQHGGEHGFGLLGGLGIVKTPFDGSWNRVNSACEGAWNRDIPYAGLHDSLDCGCSRRRIMLAVEVKRFAIQISVFRPLQEVVEQE